MAITYTWGQMTVSPRENAPEGSFSHGLVPENSMRAHINEGNFKARAGIVIEFKPGAWTDEEIEQINAGTKTINISTFGTKWRAWFGDPSPEEMAAEPWEVNA